MASSMLSITATVASINRVIPAQATMVAPFTGLKSTACFPIHKTTTYMTSITSNGGRVQCMKETSKELPRVEKKNMVRESVIGEGPFGSDGGQYTWDDGSYDGVRKMDITYDNCIHTIQVVYDKDGESVTGKQHGEKKGKNHIQITLDSNDFIASASGHYGPVILDGTTGEITVIKSLKLTTHKGKTFGPYGVDQGKQYKTETDGTIVGFFGRSGWAIDAIGFYFKEN